jgi:hypothetical protein
MTVDSPESPFQGSVRHRIRRGDGRLLVWAHRLPFPSVLPPSSQRAISRGSLGDPIATDVPWLDEDLVPLAVRDHLPRQVAIDHLCKGHSFAKLESRNRITGRAIIQ